MAPRKRKAQCTAPVSTSKKPCSGRATSKTPATVSNSGKKIPPLKEAARPKKPAPRKKALPPEEVSEDDNDYEGDEDEVHMSDEEEKEVENVSEEEQPEDYDDDSPSDNGDIESNGSSPSSKRAKTTTKNGIKLVWETGLNENEKPRSTITAIFDDMTEKAMQEAKCGCKQTCANSQLHARTLNAFLEHINGRSLNVATMCSGTESPILALILASQYLHRIGKDLDIDHLFSAEIVDWKQHYIQTNFAPPIILRDITEFLKDHEDEKNPRKLLTAYGSEVEVPGNVDLLIAGTSCVDYSSLNRNRQDLESLGESGRTFFGTLVYMKENRPLIVIFENVGNAPFLTKIISGVEKKGMNQYIHEVGYATRYIKLDTKNFYIPHTRVRGYMICIEMQQAYKAYCIGANPNPTQTQIDAFRESDVMEQLLDAWETKVRMLGCGASVPVDNMLLAPDDTRVVGLREGISHKEDKSRKPTPWEKCKVGHQDYRSKHGFGNKHAITEWHDDTYHLPDFYQQKVKGFVQRVCDTIDIAHLRNITRGFDDRYFSRTLELSQNVYRIQDDQKNGIVNCLTPTGMPFSTLRGRKINGVEALMLQGMPTEQLDLINLTQDNLRNLAGNAMTSTVVGATILSALTFFCDILPRGRGMVKKLDAHPTFLSSQKTLNYKICDPTSYEKLSTKAGQSLAALTSLKCQCEAETAESVKSFQQCKVCDHSTCASCGGSPKHNYIQASPDEVKKRKSPAEFISTIKKSIPRVFILVQNDLATVFGILEAYRHINEALVDPSIWDSICSRIAKALTSELCLRQTIRKKSWEVIFDSPNARAVLTISDKKTEWLVYVNVSDLPVGNEISKHLNKYPILRMKPDPNGLDITQGQWQMWLPKDSTINATIISSGRLIPSYKCEIGLTAHADELVATDVEISIGPDSADLLEYDVSGKYRLVPECGQAYNSLHIKIDTEGSEDPIFFFFEHELGTGDPDRHSFIFSKDCKKIEAVGTHRHYIARIDSSWRQPTFNSAQAASWTGVAIEQRDDKCIQVHGTWKNIEGLSLTFGLACSQTVSFYQLPRQVVSLKGSCDIQHIAFACHAELGDKVDASWPRNKWISINNATTASFAHGFSWIIDQVLVISGFDSLNSRWHPFLNQSVEKCSTCVLTPPTRLWKFDGKRNYPFEKPDEAALFEHALKSLPPALRAMVYVTSSGSFQMKIEMNPVTLIHQSVGRLSGTEPIQTSWKLVTDDSKFTQNRLPPLQIQSSHGEPECSQPPNFKLTLRPEQLSALHWMKNQEDAVVAFTEEEITEGRLPSLDYYLWGKATKDVRVKGGVLAFDVGFGKTAVTIGLINSQRQIKDDKDSKWTKVRRKGTIPLKATLIFVPKQLTKQWESEIKKFAPDTRNFKIKVMVLSTAAQLLKKTVASFKEADIIIASFDIYNGVAYRTLVAKYAGMVEHELTATPRAKLEWYEKALPMIRKNVDELLENPKGMRQYLDTLFSNDLQLAKSQVLPTTSKRIVGKSYRELHHAGTKRPFKDISSDNEDVVQANTPKRKPSDPFKLSNLWREEISNADDFKCPILEMFSFARVVTDEFTYVTSESNLFFLAQYLGSQANSRWLLSGTPALGDFADVKIMASLLNINLGEDDKTLKSDLAKSKIIEMTNVEKFIALRQTFSTALKNQRHAHAQKFLAHFARKDVADIGAIQFSEHIRLLDLPATEYALYLELTQRMVAQMFEIKHRKHTGSDSFERMRKSTLKCEDGREAMIICAAAFQLSVAELEKHASTPMTAQRVAEIILQARKTELKQRGGAIAKELKMAHWLQRNQDDQHTGCRNFLNWQVRVKNGQQYGDEETSNKIAAIIERTDREYNQGKHQLELFRDPSRENDTRPLLPTGMCKSTAHAHLPQIVSEIRNSTTRLSTFGESAMDMFRSLRFFQAICDIQSSAVQSFSPQMMREGNPATKITCSSCRIDSFGGRLLLPQDVIIYTKCGHTICNQSCNHNSNGACPVFGCAAISRSLQLLPGKDLVRMADPMTASQHGKKLDDIMTLIQQIPHNDKAIIFVQFDGLIDKVGVALTSAGVHFESLLGKKAAEVLMEFQLPIDGFVAQLQSTKPSQKSVAEPKEEPAMDEGDEDFAAEWVPNQKSSTISKSTRKYTSKPTPESTEMSAPVPVEKTVDLTVYSDEDSVVAFVPNRKSKSRSTSKATLNSRAAAVLKPATTTKKKPTTADAKEKEKTNTKPIKALILNIGDASASGSNLTVANHLIFVAPYLTKGSSAQQKYDAAMTQAIGRARRFGQTKRVHVYHYLANKTIDVDIIEKRSSMVLKTVEDIGEDEPPFAGFEESRVGLALPGGEDSRGEFSSSAASEIFSPGSDYA